MKMAECPFCRQPVLDLSDDPKFVNHNPEKIVGNFPLENKNPDNGNSIKKEVSKDSKKRRRCTECRNWVRWDWHFCHYCGEYQ